MVIFAMDIVH